MSTSICNSFESNAWRNDLCSHCFQSKDEHGKTDLPVSTTRYQSVLTHRPSFILRQQRCKVEQQQQQRPPGILSSTKDVKSVTNKKSVKYCEDEDEVIGYGGQEVFEEDSEEDLGEELEEDEDEEDLPFTEEERQIYNQTAKNTCFNSVSRNLLDKTPVPSFVAHGISSTNNNGPLVTIRPFGQPAEEVQTRIINPVSPMRNGQIIAEPEKITSFSSSNPNVNEDNNNKKSGNAGLTRKPPVWRPEKPRIPVKPTNLIPAPKVPEIVKAPEVAKEGQMSVTFVHLTPPEEIPPLVPIISPEEPIIIQRIEKVEEINNNPPPPPVPEEIPEESAFGFEALRAKLSLELSRTAHSSPQRSSTKRPAPQAPLVEEAPTAPAPIEVPIEIPEIPEEAPTAAPEPEKPDIRLAPKAPSIRKLLKERATQLLHRAESGSKGGRFAASKSQELVTTSDTSGRKIKLGRFSTIRKLLGLKKDSKEFQESTNNLNGSDLVDSGIVTVKSRPEIVHPLDHHGRVEVVHSLSYHRRDSGCSSDNNSDSTPLDSLQSAASSSAGRARPPPPPRTDGVAAPLDQQRPSRPPPPKSGPEPIIPDQPSSAEYANLGDVRNGMVPKKPERTNSLRGKEKDSSRVAGVHNNEHNEDGYIIPLRMKSTPSFSSSTRPQSLTSFLPASADVAPAPIRRNSRPSLRQSRLDLHVKLEDHYGTVTGANYQALAQLLEQATSKRPLAQHFHELRRVAGYVNNGSPAETSSGLNWTSFGSACDQDVVLLRTETLTVLQSSWRQHELLLAVYPPDFAPESRAPFAQPCVVHFEDQVPVPFLPAGLSSALKHHHRTSKAGVQVFPPGQVATLKQLSSTLSSDPNDDSQLQQVLCILLQLCRAAEWSSINTYSTKLSPNSAEEIVFYRENSAEDSYRLLWLPSGSIGRESITSAIRLLGPEELSTEMMDIVEQQPDGLAKFGSYLEMSLFGPDRDSEEIPVDAFQRWLDVERASVLNELIRTQGLWRVKLSVLDEFRLAFLVSSSPHHLLETSQI